jgi:hypothetical protein
MSLFDRSKHKSFQMTEPSLSWIEKVINWSIRELFQPRRRLENCRYWGASRRSLGGSAWNLPQTLSHLCDEELERPT